MREEFGVTDAEYWQTLLISEKWGALPSSEHVDHLTQCGDCVQSLLQFFTVREFVDYSRDPCFHVAYYSADVPERCLAKSLGMYSILTGREDCEGIVIGFCPWCATALPTGV